MICDRHSYRIGYEIGFRRWPVEHSEVNAFEFDKEDNILFRQGCCAGRTDARDLDYKLGETDGYAATLAAPPTPPCNRYSTSYRDGFWSGIRKRFHESCPNTDQE